LSDAVGSRLNGSTKRRKKWRLVSPPSFIEGKEAVALTSYQAEGASCHRSVKGFI
jgi:hypothetical protein